MHLYRNWIFQQLRDYAMGVPEATRYLGMIVPRARGRVLEVGIGSRRNLPLTPIFAGRLRPTPVAYLLPGRYQRQRGMADFVFRRGYADGQAHSTNGPVDTDAHGR